MKNYLFSFCHHSNRISNPIPYYEKFVCILFQAKIELNLIQRLEYNENCIKIINNLVVEEIKETRIPLIHLLQIYFILEIELYKILGY